MRISGDASSLTRATDHSQRALTSLQGSAASTSAALTALSERVNEVGDELGRTSRQARQTSRNFVALSASAGGLTVTFGTLTGVLTVGGLIAGLAALSTTLVPLAATFGVVAAAATGLAGAFSLVIGTGLLAFGKQRAEQNEQLLEQVNQRIESLEELEDAEGGLTDAQAEQLEQLEERRDKLEDQTSILGGLQSAFEDLKEEITPLLVEFGEVFVPLIEDAIDALPDLIENTLDAVGGMEVFADALRDFGEAAFRAIPRVAAALADLARRSLPTLIDLFVWLGRNGPRIFQSMLDMTRQLVPIFVGFVNAFIDAAPAIARFGTNVLRVVVPALSALVRGFGSVLSFFSDFGAEINQISQNADSFQEFVAELISRATAWLSSTGIRAVKNLAGDLLDGLTSAISPGGEGDSTLLGALTDRFADVIGDAAEWFNSGGKKRVENLIEDFLGAIGDNLGDVTNEDIKTIIDDTLSIFASLFRAVTSSLQSEEANSLGAEIGRIAATALTKLADELIMYAKSKQFRKDLSGLAGALTNSLGEALVTAGEETTPDTNPLTASAEALSNAITGESGGTILQLSDPDVGAGPASPEVGGPSPSGGATTGTQTSGGVDFSELLTDVATLDVNVSVDQQGRLVTETDVRDANATGRNTTNLNP